MTGYDDTNRGVLFREREKRNDKAPDYKGKLNVEGKDYELAGWIRESKAGNKFLSVSISEPWQGGKREETPAKQSERFQAPSKDEPDDIDSDIPF